MNCFICGGAKLLKFLDLGYQPPSDAFLRAEELAKPEAKYPLELYFCAACALVQLGYAVPPEVLFTKYVYTTGMNNSLRANFKALVLKLAQRFKLGPNDFAVDIGSNDGTLLENYAPHGVKTLGVDPSNAAEIAEQQGIPTLREFFNEKTAQCAAQKYGLARVITATNVFAHVDNLHSFMRGIVLLLRDDGAFISESGYLLDMIETLGYDAVYHEHLRYYSLRPMRRLFSDFGFEIFDVERIPSHNGSIRVYAAHKGVYQKSSAVKELLLIEEKSGLCERKTYIDFAERVKQHKDALRKLVIELRDGGKRVAGIGAPAKGNTLLNFCGFTSKEIEYLSEKSELKIGLYAPGSRIPVVSEERLFESQPDCALILSWNLSDELIQKLRGRGYKGKFIIPFSYPHIVS